MANSKSFLLDVAFLAISNIVLYYGIKFVMKQANDPTSGENKEAQEQRRRRYYTLAKRSKSPLVLNQYEEALLNEVILPEDVTTTFDDIGGLDYVIHDLTDTVLLPLSYSNDLVGDDVATVNDLYAPPSGVLLFGPPGCGKTLLAQAIAKHSGAVFIYLRMSTLTEKWYGESQKRVRAVFSLARKLAPCIMFLDEIDAFLRARQSLDHEVTAMMKAEFMSMWDGLERDHHGAQVVVLGATNRPDDLDAAILRRMPKKIFIPLPNPDQRQKILFKILRGVRIDRIDDDQDLEIFCKELAKNTEGHSGSDLKEWCRTAVMHAVKRERELTKSYRVKIPPLSLADFLKH